MVVRTERARRMAPDERREVIVSAALPLVMAHGPAVTTRQIAEAAGVAEGTIFRVFDDKDAVVHAVAERVLDPAPMLAELAAIDPEASLRNRLVTVVQVIGRRLLGVFTLLDALGLQPPRHGSPHVRPLHTHMESAVVAVIGADAGRLAVPAAELAEVLRLLTFSASHPRISHGTSLTPQRIVDTVLDGLLAPPSRQSGDRTC